MVNKNILRVVYFFLALSLGAWVPGDPGKDWMSDPRMQRALDEKSPDFQALNAALFFLTKDLRQSQGLKSLGYNGDLEKAATVLSSWLSKENVLKYPSDLRGRFSPQSKNKGKISEGLVQASFNSGATVLQIARELLSLLNASPPHKALLLSKDAVELGCGVSGKFVSGYWDMKGVLTFRLGTGVQEKPLAPPPVTTPNPTPKPVAPQTSTTWSPGTFPWGGPLTANLSPRYFGQWSKGREAYSITLAPEVLKNLLGEDKPLWALGITKAPARGLDEIFIKIVGKTNTLMEGYRKLLGDPDSQEKALVDGDTEPAVVSQWKVSGLILRVYQGETNTYLGLRGTGQN